MNFINLTNGLLAIELYNLKEWRYIRIQSTWCEQKEWERILWTLSDDFLMFAAKGEVCFVYDFSEKRQSTRAVWQGLEWIKFVLYKRWYGLTYIPTTRNGRLDTYKTTQKYFEQQYKLLSKPVKNRIDYYGKFTTSRNDILIHGITKNLREAK